MGDAAPPSFHLHVRLVEEHDADRVALAAQPQGEIEHAEVAAEEVIEVDRRQQQVHPLRLPLRGPQRQGRDVVEDPSDVAERHGGDVAARPGMAEVDRGRGVAARHELSQTVDVAFLPDAPRLHAPQRTISRLTEA